MRPTAVVLQPHDGAGIVGKAVRRNQVPSTSAARWLRSSGRMVSALRKLISRWCRTGVVTAPASAFEQGEHVGGFSQGRGQVKSLPIRGFRWAIR